MDRRTFLASSLACASQASFGQTRMPVVGFLRSTPEAGFGHLSQAFRDGLREQGFSPGQNVEIEARFADNRADLLEPLARDLIARGAVLIVGNSLAAEAAGRIGPQRPIVFVTSDDPVARGLVRSLSDPGGNATGITFFGSGQLGEKRVELLQEAAPGEKPIGLLLDESWPAAAADRSAVERACRRLKRPLVSAAASQPGELRAAFELLRQGAAAALVVGGSPKFSSQREAIIALAGESGLPTIYDNRDYPEAGGLMSYSASVKDAYRQAGAYAGRILRGARPSELPVLQPMSFEFVVNQRAAQQLNLVIPAALLARADEVIS